MLNNLEQRTKEYRTSLVVKENQEVEKNNASKRIIILEDDVKQKEKEIKNLKRMLSAKKIQEQPWPQEKKSNETGLLYKKLGTAYLKAKLYDKAIAAYKNAFILSPDIVEVNYYLGLLHAYVRGDSKKAIDYLDNYLHLSSNGKYEEKAKMLIRILQK